MSVHNSCHFFGKVVQMSSLQQGSKQPFIMFLLSLYNETIMIDDNPTLLEKPTIIKCFVFGETSRAYDVWVSPGTFIAIIAKVKNAINKQGDPETIFVVQKTLFLDRFLESRLNAKKEKQQQEGNEVKE